MNTNKAVQSYIDKWTARGYSEGIPDEVPARLMQLRKAPSYKAICVAILKNDLGDLCDLPVSAWYSELKRIEISARVVLDADTAGRMRQRFIEWH